jgi:hypothetical protein
MRDCYLFFRMIEVELERGTDLSRVVSVKHENSNCLHLVVGETPVVHTLHRPRYQAYLVVDINLITTASETTGFIFVSIKAV